MKKWIVKNFDTILLVSGLIAFIIAGVFNANGY